MQDNIRTPLVASTITPPRHVMVTVERGKLGRREKIALAGLAPLQGGTPYMGAVIAGSSTSGYVHGDLQSVKRNAFSGELAAPSPESPYSADVTASAERRGDRYVIAHDGRDKHVRSVTDGDAPLPALPQAAEKVTRPKHAPEGPAIKVDERPTVTRTEDTTDLQVSAILRGMGHKGTITPRLRSLALDVLESRRQTAEYTS